jgi:hypothetical protein
MHEKGNSHGPSQVDQTAWCGGRVRAAPLATHLPRATGVGLDRVASE